LATSSNSKSSTAGGRGSRGSNTSTDTSCTTSTNSSIATHTVPTKKRRRKLARRLGTTSDDDDESGGLDHLHDQDDSGTFQCKASWSTTRRTRAKMADNSSVGGRSTSSEQHNPDGSGINSMDFMDENPLPGFIDPITLEEVVKPAVSPYGHVMGYDSWMRCLTSSNEGSKNICPMTKKPLTKRELVVLTHENIAQYWQVFSSMSLFIQLTILHIGTRLSTSESRILY
jgi:U-box domain